MPKSSKFVLTLPLAESLVAEWQEKLWLTDWEVYIKLGPPSKEMDGNAAEIEHRIEKKRATITFANDPDSYLEFVDTVIHELCHLLFWWIDKKGMETDLLEAAFHRICGALAEQDVKLKGTEKGQKGPKRRKGNSVPEDIDI